MHTSSGGYRRHLAACVWVGPGTCKVCVGAVVILLHVACRDGKALQEFCFIGT
jgi:hypothetical protein